MRPFSFTASVVPVLVGAAAGLAAGSDLSWPLLPAVLIAAVAVHAGTNLFNDTHDYRRGVDRAGTLGGSGLLVSGQLSPSQTNRAAWLCFALAAALGAWFVVLRGWPLAAVGALGLLGGHAYTGRPVGYKYHALGDPLVFLLMGPLMVVGADLALTGVFHWTSVWAALPIGLLVMSILHGNNLRDLADDRQSGFVTIAMLLGPRASRRWYAVIVFGAFVVVGALIGLRLLPPWCAVVALAAVPALANVRRVLRSEAEADSLADIDMRSAQAHAAFGLLLFGSLLLSALL